ncbi:MAG: arsenate reductase ArsC [Planctomycetaceae bacterium]|nr:arsenate reductase ArsC [Planctomycetaceae bacterium]
MTPDHTATNPRPRVLFLCTGNACRSQMAEGWARALHGHRIEAHSAGTDPHGLNVLAVRAMAEAGVDISAHRSKRPEEILVDGQPARFDLVVTVCGNADERCPIFPGARVVHRGFDDPPRLARDAGATRDDEALLHYRRVRDEIRVFIERLDALLQSSATRSNDP